MSGKFGFDLWNEPVKYKVSQLVKKVGINPKINYVYYPHPQCPGCK